MMQQHCDIVKKSCYYRVYYSIGFACAGWSLNICKRIFHSIVYRKQLIQIYIFINQSNRICFCPPWSLKKLSKKAFIGYVTLSASNISIIALYSSCRLRTTSMPSPITYGISSTMDLLHHAQLLHPLFFPDFSQNPPKAHIHRHLKISLHFPVFHL